MWLPQPRIRHYKAVIGSWFLVVGLMRLFPDLKFSIVLHKCSKKRTVSKPRTNDQKPRTKNSSCVIPLLRICWKRAPIFEWFRNCWGTRALRRPGSTCIALIHRVRRWFRRWIGCSGRILGLHRRTGGHRGPHPTGLIRCVAPLALALLELGFGNRELCRFG
jgi:hypothetical protein